jgi:hypothetical protein
MARSILPILATFVAVSQIVVAAQQVKQSVPTMGRDAAIRYGMAPIANSITLNGITYWVPPKRNGPASNKIGTSHARLMEIPLFEAYHRRRVERRVYAQRRKAEIAANRPAYRGWTAIRRPDINIMSPIIPLNRGVVSQPPIPRPSARSGCRIPYLPPSYSPGD